MSLSDKVRKAEKKLENAQDERHEARPGSDRRERLGRIVRFWRDRLSHLLALARRREVDWHGCEPVLGKKGRELVRKAADFGLIPTSTTGGTHASTSYHYLRRAVDFGVVGSLVGTQDAWARLVNFQRWCAARAPEFVEVFGPENVACVKNGVRISIGEGTPLEQAHDNHDHIAV